MTLGDALAKGSQLGLERLDGHLLLLHALGRNSRERAWLIAHDTDPVPAACAQAFETLCRRRIEGEPVAYLLGQKEFFGLELTVDARVLVPRPETETLVEWALEVLQERTAPSVVDLGTGSGAVALALKKNKPDAHVIAVDNNADALAVARHNAARLGLEITFIQGSWLEPVSGRHDLIVSNPPYVAVSDWELRALRHEPISALVSGSDGLDDIRSIIAQAPRKLAPGGWLLLEHGWNHWLDAEMLLEAAGFTSTYRRDLTGLYRCTGGQWVERG